MEQKLAVDMTELDTLRSEQDVIDREMIKVLAKRLEIRKKISAFRITNDLPTVDPVRRAFVLSQAEKFAVENDVPPDMAKDVFNILIDWSHRLDREWRKK